jgi:hypothetical protein
VSSFWHKTTGYFVKVVSGEIEEVTYESEQSRRMLSMVLGMVCWLMAVPKAIICMNNERWEIVSL